MTTPLPVLTVSSLTFDDEFNTFTSSPDGSQGWMTTYPYGGESARTLPNNDEAEYYSDTSVGENPFSDENGVLSITATPAAPGSNPYGLPYDSGLITTYKSFSQLYGYFEVNAELPAGNGLWPAFWLLPSSNVYTSELDAFEVLGNNPNELYATTHGSTNGVWSSDSQALSVANTSTGFHTYGVDWEPTTTTFYIDGKEVASAPTPASMDTPMYMLLDLAVGGAGSWPGAPTSSSEFPASYKIDWVRAYATANTRDVSGTDSISGAVPLGTVSAPAPVTIGSGPDTVVLQLSEDAWQGDAQYTVRVDGVQVGGTMTETASHADGLDQAVTIAGNWGAGQHTVTVDFLNDAYGGSSAEDRNLYVDGASYDGTTATPGTLSLYTTGSQTLTVGTPEAGPTVTLGSGPDTLALGISEDNWEGNAQFTVTVDGQQVGGVETASASHALGQSQTFDLSGNFGSGQQTVSVDFLNDAYGGSAAEDRNLYVTSASYDGTAATPGTLSLYGTGSQSLTIGKPAPIQLGSGADTVALGISEDAWQGNAQFTVSVNGQQVGGVQTATVSHASGDDQTVDVSGNWGAGPLTVSVDFLNDAYGGTPETDRNLYVNSTSYNGQAVTPGTLSLYAQGTQSITIAAQAGTSQASFIASTSTAPATSTVLPAAAASSPDLLPNTTAGSVSGSNASGLATDPTQASTAYTAVAAIAETPMAHVYNLPT